MFQFFCTWNKISVDVLFDFKPSAVECVNFLRFEIYQKHKFKFNESF